MRRAVDSKAVVIMTVVCFIWGWQQVVIKSIADDVSPMLQMAIRCGVSAALVWLISRRPDNGWLNGAHRAGLLVGLLFTAEFFFIGQGLTLTTASHMAVFLYTAPLFAAIGLHLLAPSERLTRFQWLGVLMAFGGIAVIFLMPGRSTPGPGLASYLAGDAMGLCAGAAWGFTTVAVRTTVLNDAPVTQTLFHQLATAFVILLVVALLSGASHFHSTPKAWAGLAFQAIVVSFLSYLTWFWLLRHYLAARLGVLSFLTPLFGVVLGHVVLGEHLDPGFASGAAMVLTGALMVNGESVIRSFAKRLGGA